MLHAEAFLSSTRYACGFFSMCTSQQILDTNFKKLFSYIVRLHKPYDTLDIAPRNAGQLSPTI